MHPSICQFHGYTVPQFHRLLNRLLLAYYRRSFAIPVGYAASLLVRAFIWGIGYRSVSSLLQCLLADAGYHASVDEVRLLRLRKAVHADLCNYTS